MKIFDEIDIIINKFWSHTKIIKLKQNFSIKRKFAFKTFTEEFFKNIFYVLSWSASFMFYLGVLKRVPLFFRTLHIGSKKI